MKTEHPIHQLCGAFDVSTSGFYDWCRRQDQPCERQQQDQRLKAEIARIHEKSRQTYGAPRVQMELRRRGQRHGRNRIGRLMREQDLCGRQKKRCRVQTTDSKHDEPIAPNRLAEAPVPTRPDQLWAADPYPDGTPEHFEHSLFPAFSLLILLLILIFPVPPTQVSGFRPHSAPVS